jgi:hypothetical protein
MIAPTALLLLSLAAAPPYPPPKVVNYSDQLKSDTGTVVAVDPGTSELRINTPAGLVVYKVPPAFPVLTADGRSGGQVNALRPGQRVRLYYVVQDGAQVQELQLE